jgi:hypothetical protein
LVCSGAFGAFKGFWCLQGLVITKVLHILFCVLHFILNLGGFWCVEGLVITKVLRGLFCVLRFILNFNGLYLLLFPKFKNFQI